jgi:Zn-dependent M28 family amino/carboxypeptidase
MIRSRPAIGALITLLVASGSVAAGGLAQGPAFQDSALAQALAAPRAGAIQAHLRFLSDDLLRGRAPGTPGGDLAAAYIATQFELMGLTPGAPDGGHLQPFELVGVTSQPSLVVGVRRLTMTLDPLTDFVAWPTRAESSLAVDGELVFVGYGIDAPEWGWNDYRGTSLTGKIALVLANDPGLTDSSRFRGREGTYYGRWTYKLEQAARMGAVGAILVHTDESVGLPWSAVRNAHTGEHIQPTAPPRETLRFGAWITSDAAREILAGTGRDFDLLVGRAQRPGFRPMTLDAHVVLRIRSTLRRFEGRNVVARIPGSDPRRSREAVILTAHYDHLGTGYPVEGDSIYNGAVDNASGVAALLAAAAGLEAAGAPPHRSILLLATSAAEAGHLGARAYIRDPPVPLEWTVAMINVDRANLWGATVDAVALGAEHSSLGRYFEQAAAAEGLEPAPDPDPAAGRFFWSDHLPFAQAGVPILSLVSGTRYLGRQPEWGAEAQRAYLNQQYHQPGDELRDDFEYGGTLQQVRLLIRLCWTLANTGDFPSWSQDSEFRPAGEQLRLRRLRGRPR